MGGIAAVNPPTDPVVVTPPPSDPPPSSAGENPPPPPPTPQPDPIPTTQNNLVIDKDTTWAAGEYNYDNLTITKNATLTLEGDPASTNTFKGVKITVLNLTIDSGSHISADGKGFGSGRGPGISTDSSVGSGYGGSSFSGETFSPTYGSATKPVDLGSGGTGYNSGGGAMQIVVADTFTNNGIISADGNTTSSGGSIYVKTNKIAGNGNFRANGGALFASGYFKSPGGGGRIALYYKTSSFNGTIDSKGGCGSYDGMTTACAENGTVGIFDETTNNLYLNGSWKFLQADAPFSFNNIYISNGADIKSENGVNITANNILIDKNSFFNLADNQILNVPIITIDGSSTLTLSGSETITTNTLNISGNSLLTIVPGKILSLTIPNININSGSHISADKKGYGQNKGPGTANENMNGASYGGLGSGNVESSKYGSEKEPIDFGSGGSAPHSFGGGAIRLISTGNIVNNGIISANGENSGSGGSVYVTANTIEGSGSFEANGGGAYCPTVCFGPGGGGRVALYYKSATFSGTKKASGFNEYGGVSGDGTIYIFDESAPLPPPPDDTVPSITSFLFNGTSSDITVNPITKPLSMTFVASKNVDWVSIEIKKENNTSDIDVHKYFYPGADCDKKNTCVQDWKGELVGESLQNNTTYKIKVKIRDLVTNKDYEYYSPYLVNVSFP